MMMMMMMVMMMTCIVIRLLYSRGLITLHASVTNYGIGVRPIPPYVLKRSKINR